MLLRSTIRTTFITIVAIAIAITTTIRDYEVTLIIQLKTNVFSYGLLSLKTTTIWFYSAM